MRRTVLRGWIVAWALGLLGVGSVSSLELPWREAGLTERQAAAHLLERFAYGPRPGEVDDVVSFGLGNWVESQLAGDFPGAVLSAKLSRLPAVALSHEDIVRRYSYTKGKILQEALAKGVVTREDYYGNSGERRLRDAQAALERFAAEQGMQPETGLIDQLRDQKLLRAVDSESQMVEVLTDFWFNHFNVSTHSHGARVHMLSYERDAIRPRVLTTFRELLGATAKHPAMLHYLGNALSVADPSATTLFDLEVQELDRLSPLDNPTLRLRLAKDLGWTQPDARRRRTNQPIGLNENYARELLELHTLGVRGGYSQRDVVAVARAFTGWTAFPTSGARDRLEKIFAEPATALNMGFVIEGEFLFRADRHDSDPKFALGQSLAAGRGIEDGEEVLDILARHPSTARHLARKLAVRFVSERPPEALVERLVNAWELSGGDLTEIVLAVVRSPEFWSDSARRSKIKTPFELAASTLRALAADLTDPKEIERRIARMGQPIYAYSAPTGFPDRNDAWVHVGPLLARVNFGRDLARNKIRGVSLDLPAILGRHRLETLEDAFAFFFPRLMPARDPGITLDLLGAADAFAALRDGSAPKPPSRDPQADLAAQRKSQQLAARAVGILIGSPEFQVR